VPTTHRGNLAGIESVSTQRSQFLRDGLPGGSPFLPKLTLAQLAHHGPGPICQRCGQIAVPVSDLERAVASYRDTLGMRFLYILQRDWATIGPKLRGKIHITSGTMDNGYLNNAVYQI
jgi:hypothetical protein